MAPSRGTMVEPVAAFINQHLISCIGVRPGRLGSEIARHAGDLLGLGNALQHVEIATRI